jgi:hypothetical protein
MKVIGEMPKEELEGLVEAYCPNCELRHDCRNCDLYEGSLLAVIIGEDYVVPSAREVMV